VAKKTASRTPSPGDRVVLLHGKDAFLRAEHTVALREALTTEHGEVDVLNFDGASAPVADVLDECRSFGLLVQHKLVVVDEADQFVKDTARALVERYCESPCDGATLVLRAEKWHRGKLDKLIEASGAIVKCDAPTETQAQAWAVRRCEKRHGGRLDPDAARALVERLGADLGRIDSELGKLAAAAGRSPCGEPVPIGRDLVAQFVGLSREEEVWGIQSELLSGDAERSLAHLRAMLDISRHHPVLVGYACLDLARKLSAITHAIDAGVTPQAAAKSVRLWGASSGPIMRTAERMRPERAGELLDAAVEADAAQKTGRGTPERLLEALALKFAGATG